MRIPLTADRLHQLFWFDDSTGSLRWRVTRAKAKANAVAGCLDADGYLIVGVDGHRYKSHRLVWLMHFGSMPAGNLDHWDCDKTNNRPANLRIATGSQNRSNTRRQVVNTSGYKGVNWNKAAKRWRAIVKFGGQVRFLGYFDDPSVAHGAYVAAASEMQGQFARAA